MRVLMRVYAIGKREHMMSFMPKKRSLAWLAAGTGVLMAWQKLLRYQRQYDLHGKVVLVTGSSRGLGLGLAEEYARAGARLIICAREPEELEQARQKLAQQGAAVLAVQCDMTDREQVQRLIDQGTEHYGQIDVLVNNAGIITVGPIASQTLEDFEISINVMFWGPVYATMAVLPQMLARKSGRIVNITSIGGKISAPHLLPYNSAKFAAVGFSEGLHAELAKDGIHVLTIAPGLMRTGSPLHARFKGNSEKEYAWFGLSDNLPGISMDAHVAAQKIVQATQNGDTDLTLTLPAKLVAAIHGTMPGLTADVLGVVNRFLPAAQGNQKQVKEGAEIPFAKSALTPLGEKAAHEFNQTAE